MTSQAWIRHSALTLALWLGLTLTHRAAANGGPFVIKYPDGDPAAKGVLARIDPDLKPGREESLRVVKEDLKVVFSPSRPDFGMGFGAKSASGGGTNANPADPIESTQPPLAMVSAIYTIENPTDAEVEVEFGFPILRGIYIHPFSMTPNPEVKVTVDGERIQPDLISNSMIYGLIRHRSSQVIEGAIAADPRLARLVATVRATSYVRQRARELVQQVATNQETLLRVIETDPSLSRLVTIKSDAADTDRTRARKELLRYLTGRLKWETGPANLLLEYASLELENSGNRAFPLPGRLYWGAGNFGDFGRLAYSNLGRLGAIGEQKATQLFAELAARFDPSTRTAYETIFSAWGGDVRERAVDLGTGKVRPRELTLRAKPMADPYGAVGSSDPTLYARLEYINTNIGLTISEHASCQTILKHLPVTFTFAPMNLVHYKAKFPARKTRTLTVSYKQYAYVDTAKPASFQLAYVLHPASLWKDFGPIQLEVALPAQEALAGNARKTDAAFLRGSVPLEPAGIEERDLSKDMPEIPPANQKRKMALYRGAVAEKTGELFLAVDAGYWQKVTDAASQLTVR